MKLLRNIFIFLILAAMVGCGGESLDKQLAQAEILIEEQPDSAFALLNEILFPEELPLAQRAEYARLYAKAAGKSGNSFLTDTLLVNAARYYLSVNDSLAAHECYLLEGERQSKIENTDKAMEFMETALSLLPDSLSADRDLINHNIFQTIVSPNSFDKAKPYARRLLASKDSAYVALGYYDLGCAYSWQKMTGEDKAVADSAFLFVEKAVAIAERNNARYLPHFLRNSVNPRLPKAEILRRLHKEMQMEGESSNSDADLAYCHLRHHEPTQAEYYLDRADSLYRLYWASNGNEYVTLKNQLATLRTALNLMQGKQDFLIFHGPFNDSIYFAGQRYQANQTEALNNLAKTNKRELLHAERRHNQTTIILCLIFALIISVAGISLYIRIKRRKWAETQEKIETLERMIKETTTDGTEKTNFKKVLLQQLGVIKLIASTPTETNRNLLRSISRLQWEGKDFDGVLNWPDIYSLIDSIFDGFHTRLTARFGSLLNEKEIQLICLLRADFSTKEISVLVEQSTRTIYQRKSEIRRKLRLDEAADIISELTAKLTEPTTNR